MSKEAGMTKSERATRGRVRTPKASLNRTDAFVDFARSAFGVRCVFASLSCGRKHTTVHEEKSGWQDRYRPRRYHEARGRCRCERGEYDASRRRRSRRSDSSLRWTGVACGMPYAWRL